MNTPVLKDVDTQPIAAGLKPADLIGTIVAHKYKLIESLGAGGMGIVFKAQHMLMNKTVAIKMLHPHLIVSDHCLIRFQHEAKAASHISHSNIISVFDFGTTEAGQPFIVMDYVRGRSLETILKEEGALDPERCLKIFTQVADALTEAHKSGVIHRDLKPSNVMLVANVDGSESVRIVDFGIAKFVNSDAHEQLTKTGEIFGSPCYMSPEQCRGSVLDQRSDIYSLGCVLYEALTGKPPFHGKSIFETMYFHLNRLPSALSIPPGRGPQYRNRLEPIVFKALEKSPDHRMQSMSELASSLRAALRDNNWLSNQAAVCRNWTAAIARCSQDRVYVRWRTVVAGIFTLALASTSAIALSLVPQLRGSDVQDAPLHFGSAYMQSDPPPLPENFEAREMCARVPLDSLKNLLDGPETRKAGLSWIQWGDFDMKYHLYGQAEKEYMRAYWLTQRSPASWMTTERSAIAKNLAECCYCLQDYGKAKTYYETTIELVRPLLDSADEYFVKPSLRLADIYMHEGNFTKAKEYKETALSIMQANGVSPSSSDYLCCQCDLGEIYYRQGRFHAAAMHYERAITGWMHSDKLQEQSTGYCQYNLALCNYKSGRVRDVELDFGGALKHLTNAAASSADINRVSATYARFLWDHGDWLHALTLRLKTIN